MTILKLSYIYLVRQIYFTGLVTHVATLCSAREGGVWPHSARGRGVAPFSKRGRGCGYVSLWLGLNN